MRPAHIHFRIDAPGYESLTTALYSSDDPYVHSDAVFGVKPSLVIEYVSKDGGYDAISPNGFRLISAPAAPKQKTSESG